MCGCFKLWEMFVWSETKCISVLSLIIIVWEHWRNTSKLIHLLGLTCNRLVRTIKGDEYDFERPRTVGLFLHKDIILTQVSTYNTQDQSAQHLCRPNATWTLSCLSSALHQVNVRIVKYIHHHTSKIYLRHSQIGRENRYLQPTSSLHRHISHSTD